MDIIVAFIAACITVIILNKSKINKTSSQLMLLGIEITIIGAIFILAFFTFNPHLAFGLIGIALVTIGFIVNLFGFSKK